MDPQLRDPNRGRQSQVLGGEPGTGGDHLRAGLNVLAGAPDVRSGLGVQRDDDRLALAHTDFLDDHGVGALGHGRAGEDARGRARLQRRAGRSSRDALGDPQPSAAVVQIGVADGIAIHGAVVPAWDIDVAPHRRGQYAPEPGLGRDGLGVGDRLDPRQQEVDRLLLAQRRALIGD